VLVTLRLRLVLLITTSFKDVAVVGYYPILTTSIVIRRCLVNNLIRPLVIVTVA
jgi:hypothetical protein